MTFEELLKLCKENKMVVCKLGASWCGPCRALAPIYDEVKEENSDVAMFEVDIDDSQEIVEEYGIVSVPTILFFLNGEPFDMKVGLCKKTDIEGVLENMRLTE